MSDIFLQSVDPDTIDGLKVKVAVPASISCGTYNNTVTRGLVVCAENAKQIREIANALTTAADALLVETGERVLADVRAVAAIESFDRNAPSASPETEAEGCKRVCSECTGCGCGSTAPCIECGIPCAVPGAYWPEPAAPAPDASQKD